MTAHDPALTPLFQPLSIGPLTLKNRIAMAPMTRQFSPDNCPGEDVAGYYRRRAAGETGLIVTEGVGVDHPLAVDTSRIPVMAGDAPLKGWRRVVEDVHGAGGVIFPQLWHQGMLRDPVTAKDPGMPSLRPSAEFGPIGTSTMTEDFLARAKVPGKAMTESDIADVIAAFGRSAAHAARLGFDGIAIHGAHGYMIDSFLWAGTNHRTDGYGGDAARRARFAAEIVKVIRAAVGSGLPILFRFSNFKLQDYGAQLAASPQELEALLAPLADAGVDIFDGSNREYADATFAGSPLNLAGWAKKITGKITMTVGNVNRETLPPLIERLARGEFDLVAMGRALMADPAWAHKIRVGDPIAPFDPETFTRLT